MPFTPPHIEPQRPGELTVNQCAQLYRIGNRTWLRAIEAGKLPARKLPGKTGAWLVWTSDAERFAQDFYGATAAS